MWVHFTPKKNYYKNNTLSPKIENIENTLIHIPFNVISDVFSHFIEMPSWMN